MATTADPYEKWNKEAPQFISDLIHNFGFKPFQAAAFPGNFAAESDYFRDITEDGAINRGMAGGNGYGQWTGTKIGQRRWAFDRWWKRKGWKPDSYFANYSFLYRELMGLEGNGYEKKIVPRVKDADTIEEATRRVWAEYERPADSDREKAGARYGYSLPRRIKAAKEALALWEKTKPTPTVWPADTKPTPTPTPTPKPVELTKEQIMAIQAILPALLANPTVMKMIVEAVTNATRTVAINPTTNIQPREVPLVSAQVMNELQQIPEFQHLTSTEPEWYQSRANWSALISAITAVVVPIVGVFGVAWTGFTAEQVASMAGGLGFIGAGLAAYLAKRARSATRPLFSKEPDETTRMLAQVQRELAELRAQRLGLDERAHPIIETDMNRPAG